jgi:hypothetical protein
LVAGNGAGPIVVDRSVSMAANWPLAGLEHSALHHYRPGPLERLVGKVGVAIAYPTP